MTTSANGSQAPEHDAQRSFEQRALRNVRDLVDSMQAHEAAQRRAGRRLAAGLGVLFLGVLGWFGYAMIERRAVTKEAVVAPAPAKRGPPPDVQNGTGPAAR